jgi:hypothetical protein
VLISIGLFPVLFVGVLVNPDRYSSVLRAFIAQLQDWSCAALSLTHNSLEERASQVSETMPDPSESVGEVAFGVNHAAP